MTIQTNIFPSNWTTTNIGNEFIFNYGKGLVKEKRAQDGLIPVFGSNGIVGFHNKALIDVPCIIVGRKGAIGEIHLSKSPCWPIDTTYYIVPPENIDLLFSYYFLKSLHLEQLDKSTAIPGLNRTDAYNIPFKLPPLHDQKKIVSKIEELFTQLDAAEAALKRAKNNLKRYKQSLLQAAVTGELTHEWREAQKNELEPANKLLERIKSERKAKWEAEIRAKGKDPAKEKYQEPKDPDTSNLLELPEGWCWVSVHQISESMKNGIYKPAEYYSDDGIACLRMYNIEDGKIVWKNIKRMNLTVDEYNEYCLLEGDILVNRVNSRELVGKSAVITSSLDRCVFESKNIRLRINNNLILSHYLNIWFLHYGRKYFNFNAQQVVGMASINQDQLGAMELPLPSIEEQEQIIQKFEDLNDLISRTDKSIIVNLRHIEKLRQSILHKAFTGKLFQSEKEIE
jgi:type I restriction enzyme S subunit